MRERGLKPYSVVMTASLATSLPMRERGLKPATVSINTYYAVSLPMRVSNGELAHHFYGRARNTGTVAVRVARGVRPGCEADSWRSGFGWDCGEVERRCAEGGDDATDHGVSVARRARWAR